MNRYLVGLALLLVIPLLAPPAAAERPVERRLAAPADGAVEIENLAGSVEITGTAGAEIVVTGTVGDDVEELEIEQKGSRTRIAVRLPERRGWNRREIDADAHLKIELPTGSRVLASTVSADLEARGVRGRLELKSVSGDIALVGRGGEVYLETVSGDLRFTGDASRLRLQSVSGNIHAGGSAPELEMETVSGNAEVTLDEIDRARLQAVSGGLKIETTLAADAELSAEVHSGDVVVALPAGTAADFEIQTYSGRIRNDFGPPAERTQRYGPGKSIRFSTGGGATVRLQSFSGTVRLVER